MSIITIAGRVCDSVSGNPIQNATIRVRKHLGSFILNTSTDVDGEFEFDYNASGGESLMLRIDKDPGYRRKFVRTPTLPIDEDQLELADIKLEPYTSSQPSHPTLPVRVRFINATIFDDTDALGSGEIYFRFTVNGRDLITGKHDISSGDTIPFPPQYSIDIPAGSTNVQVGISARDDDTWFGENNPFVNAQSYEDIGSTSETWSNNHNFGRGTHDLATVKFKVTYIIEG